MDGHQVCSGLVLWDFRVHTVVLVETQGEGLPSVPTALRSRSSSAESISSLFPDTAFHLLSGSWYTG